MPRLSPFPTLVGTALGISVVLLSAKAVVLLVGVLGVAAMFAWPELAYYMIVAATPIQLDFGGGVTVSRIVLPLGVLIIGVHILSRRIPWPQFLVWPAGHLGLWYFCAAAMSVLYAANTAEAVREILVASVYILLFFLTLSFVRTPHQFYRLFWVLVIVGVAEALIAIAQIEFRFILPGEWRPAALEQIDISGRGFRAEATAAHPIMLAGFLQTVIPLSICLFVLEPRYVRKVFLAIGILAMFYAWYNTYARSSMIGMITMALVALTISSRTGRNIALAVGGVGIALIAIYSASPAWLAMQVDDIEVANRIFEHADLNSSSVALRFRLESWAGGWLLFMQHPVLGVGYGQAINEYMTVLPAWASSPVHPEVIHNVFIEVATETGLIGLLPFVGLWIWAFIATWRARHDSALGPYAKALMVVLAGHVTFLSITPMIREIWLVLAMAACVGAIHRGQNERRNPNLDPLHPAEPLQSPTAVP